MIYAERARIKQEATIPTTGQKGFQPSDVPTSAPHKEPTDDYMEDKKTRDKVAEDVGMKRTTYTKTEELVDKADSGNKLARDLLDKVNASTITTNAASETLTISEKANDGNEKAQKVLKSVIRGDIRTNGLVLIG